MKNMPLRELRKKRDSYFKNLGIVTTEGRTKKQIEYIVKKSWEILPKELKKYYSDADKSQTLNVLYHTILVGGKHGKMEPYNALMQQAIYKGRLAGTLTRRYKVKGKVTQIGTNALLYKRLRREEPQVYSKYNSYMYRLGYSASSYFMDSNNVTKQQNGSVITFVLDLPNKPSGISYDVLYIEYDFSGQEFYAEMQ